MMQDFFMRMTKTLIRLRYVQADLSLRLAHMSEDRVSHIAALTIFPTHPTSLIRGMDPASILHKSIAGHYRPVSYPDGPIMARYRFM